MQCIKPSQVRDYPQAKTVEIGDKVLVPQGFKPNGESLPWKVEKVTQLLGKFCRVEKSGLTPIQSLRLADKKEFPKLKPSSEKDYLELSEALINGPKKKVPKSKISIDRLKKTHDSLMKKVNNCHADRNTHTPRMMRQAMYKRLEGDRYLRRANIIRGLVCAFENGDKFEELEGLSTQDLLKAIEKASRMKTVDPQGYYDWIKETNDPYYDDDLSILLRTFSNRKEVEANLKKRKLEELISTVRFAKIPGFFPTPDDIIDMMINRVYLDHSDTVLEPSAGIGSIADKAKAIAKRVNCIEQHHNLIQILKEKGHTVEYEGDFLKYFPQEEMPTVILMNPPFEKLQDIEHVKHAYECLAPNGRLCAIMSAGVKFRNDKLTKKFREWLDTETNADIEDLPEGSFKKSFVSTGVSAIMVTLSK